MVDRSPVVISRLWRAPLTDPKNQPSLSSVGASFIQLIGTYNLSHEAQIPTIVPRSS